ncbi:MAG: hypothetical protein KF691_02900 [Phycisphaeraceae bacterium]|nr:hypothetical protein [Phycisphaeraceae bacterium]
MLCSGNLCSGEGGRVPFGISLFIALTITLISVGVLVIAGATKFGFGIFLPLFAGPLAFGVLRIPAAARVHPAWPLIGFPIMIGLTIFCTVFLGATRGPSSGGGCGTMFWLLPVLYASTLNGKSKCESSRVMLRLATLAVGIGVLAFFGIAMWRVWEAWQSGAGPAYAAIGDRVNIAAIWMGVMILVGAASVLTRPLRIEDDQDRSQTPMEY